VVLLTEQAALSGADGGLDNPGRVLLRVEFEVLQALLDEIDLVLIVVDHEAVAQSDDFTVDTEYAAADGVKRADGERFTGATEQFFKAVTHLSGSLVGERDCHDAVGAHAA
jgi:hypothetical protein